LRLYVTQPSFFRGKNFYGWLNLVNSPYGNSAINLFIKDTLPAEEIQNEKKKLNGKGKLSF
jgi:hypothetical protein